MKATARPLCCLGIWPPPLSTECRARGLALVPSTFFVNEQEHERHAYNAVISERALREIYLMPFHIAQRDSKPPALMTASNRINGIHISGDPRLLEDILRQEWGCDGVVLSDWFGTFSAAESVNAGLDLEMPGPPRVRGANVLVSIGCRKVTERKLDERVRNLVNLANVSTPLTAPSSTTRPRPASTVPKPRRRASCAAWPRTALRC